MGTTRRRGFPHAGWIAISTVVVWLALFTTATRADMPPIYGPKQFQRASGAPQKFIDTFENCDAAAQYKIVVLNGNPDGTNRASSASISLNGVNIIGPQDFNQQVAKIERPVAVSHDNQLSVQIASAAGSLLTVSVECTASCLDVPSGPPLFLSLPPRAAMVGKSMRYQVCAASRNPSTLTYSLSAAPAGMTIDPKTGLLTWTPGSAQLGDQLVTIVAKDSVGQKSQSFTLSVFDRRTVALSLISATTGGVITVNDPTSKINGLSINIPAGALASDTTIVISELISPPTLGGTHRFLMKGFSIDPDGTPLTLPATISIPYSVNEFNTTNQGIPLEDFLGVYFLQPATGSLQYLSNFIVDKVNHVVTGSVPHFSVYEVTNVARLCPPPTGPVGIGDCPNGYSPATPSGQLPALVVHGWEFGMGDEGTWGQLRYMLEKLDAANCGSGQSTTCGRIDAWRFDWDVPQLKFEDAAGQLYIALLTIQTTQTNPLNPVNPVNIVAHSFGGIVVRTYLESQAMYGGTATAFIGNVNRVMTIGTPHTGIGGPYSTPLVWPCLGISGGTGTWAWPSCIEADTGIGIGGLGLALGGSFLNTLNSIVLPGLQSTTLPQYDFVVGQAFCNPESKSCQGAISPLMDDDGLITTAGEELCNFYPGACISGIIKRDPVPGSDSAAVGLCHTAHLCSVNAIGGRINVNEVEVDDKTHPLWEKICTFLVDDVNTCTKNTLTVTLSDPAAGTVTSVPPGIHCGNTCSAGFNKTTVVLSEIANDGFEFTGWGGDCAGSTTFSSAAVFMDADKNCVATFSSQETATLTVTLSSDGDGTGTVTSVPAGINCGTGGTDCSTSFPSGTSVFLKFTPDPGSYPYIYTPMHFSGSFSPRVTLTASSTSILAAFYRQPLITNISCGISQSQDLYNDHFYTLSISGTFEESEPDPSLIQAPLAVSFWPPGPTVQIAPFESGATSIFAFLQNLWGPWTGALYNYPSYVGECGAWSSRPENPTSQEGNCYRAPNEPVRTPIAFEITVVLLADASVGGPATPLPSPPELAARVQDFQPYPDADSPSGAILFGEVTSELLFICQ